MDSVSVNRDDIDALAQALDAGVLPAADLLRSLVAAIRQVSGDDQSVTVEVEVEAEVAESLKEQFAAAFTPEPAGAAPHQVHVSVKKITR
jgi:hypothetical protein